VTLADRVDDLKDGVRNAGSFLNNINLVTGWSQSNPDGWSTSLLGGVGPIRLPVIGASWGSPYNPSFGTLQMRAGPMMIDNIYVGYGAIYDDIHGSFPGKEQISKDKWGQIVTLTFRASFAIGDSIGLSIQPYLYYLPDKGQVGWGLPGPMAGFMGYQPNAMALAQISWNKQIGNWNFTAYDVFSPRIYQYNIWDVFLSSQSAFGNLSPLERVGRYSLGYGAGDLTNYNPQFGAGLRPSSWNGMAGYYNILGLRAVGTLGPSTKSLFYLYRSDFWDKKFQTIASGLTGGAYIQTGNVNTTAYVGYNFASFDSFSTLLNWAVAGVRQQLGPAMTVYAQGGGNWYSGDNKGPSGALVTLGVQQRLGQQTAHYLEVGRRVYTPVTGPYGIENYVDYRINHMIGYRTNLSAYVGTSERHIATVGNSLTVKYAGAIFNTLLTMRLSAFASSGWAKTSSGSSAYIYDAWTHRFGLRYNLTQNIQSQAFYQYQEVHSNSSSYNYSEHFIYIGVTKRF
jgi:hypothetical protein